MCGLILFRKAEWQNESFNLFILEEVSDLKCSFQEVSKGTQPYFGIVPVFSWASLLLIWLHTSFFFFFSFFWITIKSFCSLLIRLRNLCYSPPPHIFLLLLLLLIVTCLGLEYLLPCWFLRFLSLSLSLFFLVFTLSGISRAIMFKTTSTSLGPA